MIPLVLTLLGGVITEDFMIGQDSVVGFQHKPSVAVRENGSFAVAWYDEFSQESMNMRADVFIKFFDENGKPLSSPLRLNQDTISNEPYVAVDGNGSYMCIWTEAVEPVFHALYGQVFDSTGAPLTDRFMIEEYGSAKKRWAHSVGGSPAGGFMVSWGYDTLFAQRFTSGGGKTGEEIVLRVPTDDYRENHSVDLNGQGMAVVVWRYLSASGNQLRFQIVDSENNPVLDSFNFVIDDPWGVGTLHTLPSVRWIDDENFAIFWYKARVDIDTTHGIQAKRFNSRGDSISEIITLIEDPWTWFIHDPLSVSSACNGKFAVLYQRKLELSGENFREAGFLIDTDLTRLTGIFRVPSSEPFDELEEWYGSVDATQDRIVWVWADNSQQRECPEEFVPYYSDVHCKITDWDLTGIAEPPEVKSPIHLETSINRLSYKIPGEAELTLYSADGRRVLTQPVKGKGTWTPSSQPSSQLSSHLPSGVYFVCISTGDHSARAKVVVIR